MRRAPPLLLCAHPGCRAHGSWGERARDPRSGQMVPQGWCRAHRPERLDPRRPGEPAAAALPAPVEAARAVGRLL